MCTLILNKIIRKILPSSKKTKKEKRRRKCLLLRVKLEFMYKAGMLSPFNPSNRRMVQENEANRKTGRGKEGKDPQSPAASSHSTLPQVAHTRVIPVVWNLCQEIPQLVQLKCLSHTIKEP